MKILLTNDDGIYADGIQTLAKNLKNDHELVIAAPDRERSAAGHSITIHEPLRAKKVYFEGLESVDSYKINGTPADCVKLGVEKLFKPDLIISGINDGENLGYDILYSGTVSAAMEGWMNGFNSIAVSLATKKYRNFNLAAKYMKNFIEKIEQFKINNHFLFNVNIPDISSDQFKTVSITRLGKNVYEDGFEERVDPMGNSYYWLTGKIKGRAPEDTDIWALNHNQISITPIQLNLTNLSLLKQLNSIFNVSK